MGSKITSLESALTESREKVAAVPSGQGERDKYKALARRLKEERNQYKEMVEVKNTEQAELQVEMDKMTEMIAELRENCNALQRDLLSARQDDVKRQDASVQTGSTGMSGIPPVRRASLTELSPRARLSPKRTISNISQSSLSSNSNSPRSASQLQKSIELSRPKQRSASMSSCSSSPAKGARIAKPVARQPSVPTSPRAGGSRSSSVNNSSSSPRSPLASPRPSRIPSSSINSNNNNNNSNSKNGSPARSRLPLPTGGSPARSSSIPMPSERREVLHIEEEVEEEKEDPMSQSDSSSLLAEAEAVSRIVTVQLERVLSRETSPTMETGDTGGEEAAEEEEDRKEEEDEFH